MKIIKPSACIYVFNLVGLMKINQSFFIRKIIVI